MTIGSGVLGWLRVKVCLFHRLWRSSLQHLHYCVRCDDIKRNDIILVNTKCDVSPTSVAALDERLIDLMLSSVFQYVEETQVDSIWLTDDYV